MKIGSGTTGFESFWEPLEITDVAAVEYLTRLFSEPEHLSRYSLEQVAEGIWFLIGGSSPAKASRTLLNQEIEIGERLNCIKAMANFFLKFVAPRTPGTAMAETDAFHGACFMWWHIFPASPTHVDAERVEPLIHATCIDVMRKMLDLPSELCELSALHGLNHWHELYPSEVETIIDTFVKTRDDVTPRIREYAADARAGRCQ